MVAWWFVLSSANLLALSLLIVRKLITLRAVHICKQAKPPNQPASPHDGGGSGVVAAVCPAGKDERHKK